MTRQATLHTDRLTLVPLAAEHLRHEVELDSDPQVMRYSGSGRARSPDEVVAFHRRRLADADRVPGLGFWVGFLSDSGGSEFVGWWQLGPADEDPAEPGQLGQAELGYRLLRRHWRRGLASEGSRELLRHGFLDLGLHRIFAQTMTVNEASRATMASVGLRFVRTFFLDWDEPIAGAEQGEVEYAMTRDEWLERQQR